MSLNITQSPSFSWILLDDSRRFFTTFTSDGTSPPSCKRSDYLRECQHVLSLMCAPQMQVPLWFKLHGLKYADTWHYTHLITSHSVNLLLQQPPLYLAAAICSHSATRALVMPNMAWKYLSGLHRALTWTPPNTSRTDLITQHQPEKTIFVHGDGVMLTQERHKHKLLTQRWKNASVEDIIVCRNIKTWLPCF